MGNNYSHNTHLDSHFTCVFTCFSLNMIFRFTSVSIQESIALMYVLLIATIHFRDWHVGCTEVVNVSFLVFYWPGKNLLLTKRKVSCSFYIIKGQFYVGWGRSKSFSQLSSLTPFLQWLWQDHVFEVAENSIDVKSLNFYLPNFY